ncbi:hypothetical protein [Rhodoferax sp.]|uniref:hypothetical protein n=1 Tax=Rhodoferax sp. TaxID=50421 RepID=UPI00374D28C2
MSHDSPWNADLMLPRVTDNAKLLELQILLGGLHLVLSRVHPAFAASRFLASRQLAMRLTRGIEYNDARKAHMASADLQRALTETERALDPGSLMVLRKLLTQALKDDDEAPELGHAEFTYSDFMAEEQLAAHQLAAAH